MLHLHNNRRLHDVQRHCVYRVHNFEGCSGIVAIGGIPLSESSNTAKRADGNNDRETPHKIDRSYMLPVSSTCFPGGYGLDRDKNRRNAMVVPISFHHHADIRLQGEFSLNRSWSLSGKAINLVTIGCNIKPTHRCNIKRKHYTCLWLM